MDSSNPSNLKKKSPKGMIIAVVIAIIVIVAAFAVIELDHKKTPTLVILVGSGSMTQQYITMVATDFEKQNPNVKVDVTTAGYSDLLSTEETALKGGASVPNIVMYYASQAPTLAPYLYNIPTSTTGAPGTIDSSNFIEGNMYSGGYSIAPNGTILKTIGIPIHTVIGYMLVYQNKIFDNTTLQNEFQSEYHFSFQPSTYKNWTALYDAASFINASTSFNGHSDHYALMFPDSSSHSIIDAFYNVAYPFLAGNSSSGVPANSSPNYWTYFGNQSGKFNVSFNNSAAVNALTTYKSLIQFEPSVSVQPVGYSEQLSYFETGDYAVGLAWSSFFPDYSNSSISSVAGNYSVALLPGGYTGYSPTLLGINPHSQNTSLAVKFLEFATSSSEYAKGISQFDFLPGNANGLKAAEGMSGFGWVNSFLNYSSTINLNPKYAAVVTQVSPLFSTLIPDFNSEVYDYFTGKTTASNALSVAASEWVSTIKSDNIQL